MPKPKSKQELLDLSQINYKKLLALINAYTKEEIEREFPIGTMNRNVRDVCAHLHHWHLMMLEWYVVGMKGEKPNMPAQGYTWRNLPDLNKKIWEDYQGLRVDVVMELLENSYSKVQEIINNHTNEELFEKKKYKWTGTTSLATYLISNTSSHYNWAIKLIKKSMK